MTSTRFDPTSSSLPRALMNGATNMTLGLSWSAMSLGGGYIAAGLGYPTLFLTGAAVTVAGALLFWAYFRVPRGEFARAAAPDTDRDAS